MLTPDAAFELAPFVVLRVATVPFDMLDDVRSPRLDATVGLVLQSEQELEASREKAEDALFRCVPRLPANDRELRRQLLSFRRDIHNSRLTHMRELLVARLEPYLACSGDGTALKSWTSAEMSLWSARQSLATIYPEELQATVRPGLRKILGNVNFSKSLELVNSGLFDSLDRERTLPNTPWPSSLERSLLLYLGRAAAKTSPLFGFMGVATIAVSWRGDHGEPRAATASYLHEVSIGRGTVARLDHETRHEVFRNGSLVAHVNPSLRPMPNGRQFALCNRDIVMAGRPWSEQHVGHFRLDTRLAACLAPGQQDDWLGWVGRLRGAGVPQDQIERTLDRMLDRGVLVVEPLTDALDNAPVKRLQDRWANSGVPRLVELSDKLSELREAVDYIWTSDGCRATTVSRIRTTETFLRQQDRKAATEPLQNLLYETCWLNDVSGVVGPRMLKPVLDLGAFLGSQVVMSPMYVKLRAAFLHEFGVGGICTDPVGFLLRATPFVTTVPEFGSRIVREKPERAPVGVRLPITVLAQMTAPATGCAPTLVVNRVFEGGALLAARFTSGRSHHTQVLTTHLSDWLRRLSHPREPIDFLVSGHCNDLQAHARLTQRVLCWPGEQVTRVADQVVMADSLRLSHNPASDLIEVEDQNGRALQICYLGTMNPSPIWGTRYLLAVLAQPYALSRPEHGPKPGWSGEKIEVTPRRMHGCMCPERKHWWVSTEYMKTHWFDRSPADWLIQIRRDFDRHAIPYEVFAQRYVTLEAMGLAMRDLFDSSRKPMWIDIRNPFCLGLVEHLSRSGDWVAFSEMLPAPDDVWFQIDDKRHITELHLEMMVTSTAEAMEAA